MADTRPPRYWHGGKPDVRVGDLIEPRRAGDIGHTADCTVCATAAADEPAFVYVTTDREYARLYAFGVPRGDLYRVEPIGELIETTGRRDHVPTWAAEGARVIAVYERFVHLTPKQAFHIDATAGKR